MENQGFPSEARTLLSVSLIVHGRKKVDLLLSLSKQHT